MTMRTVRPMSLSAMGLVTPIGCGKSAVSTNLFAGTRDGLVHRRRILPDREVCVGYVDMPLLSLPEQAARYESRNSRLMWQALEQIEAEVAAARDRYGADRIAVILGTSTSGLAEGEVAFANVLRQGAWPENFDYRQQELGSLAEGMATALRLTGPAYTISTACSSSAKVFASARRLIAAGICDAAIVGGADTLCGTTLNGFGSLDAISAGLCQPFSLNRDGINIGEGAAAFLMTTEVSDVSLLGFGESSDAHHLSAPDPSGAGALAAMEMALEDAAIGPGDIAYVNLHGTGTPLNDVMEGIAVNGLLGAETQCSSTKGMTGHMLGAAGACEAAFLWLAMHPDFGNRRLPPHLWDGVADPGIPPLNLTAAGCVAAASQRLAMISNSFAFGGSNTALILGGGAW